MGLKGELGDGFPQPTPAFILTVDWDTAHVLGPTTQPKNILNYVKFRGTIKSVPGSSFPPLHTEFVDGGAWLQEEILPSGEKWLKVDSFGLLRVIDPPNASADPAVAETETGLLRMKWYGVGTYPDTLQPSLEKDGPELLKVVSRVDDPGAGGVVTCSFETGDPRYKYLEHAVYVGNHRLVIVPEEGGRKAVIEFKVSYLAP